MNGKAAIFSEDGGLISHRRCRLNWQFCKIAGPVLHFKVIRIFEVSASNES